MDADEQNEDLDLAISSDDSPRLDFELQNDQNILDSSSDDMQLAYHDSISSTDELYKKSLAGFYTPIANRNVENAS
jgi:hypothetical protein